MSVTYVNKKGEYVEVSPCFTRIRDLELPDLNTTHPKDISISCGNELNSTINSFLTNPTKIRLGIPTVIYNPILENILIRNELEKEKKARLILEERVKKLENSVVRPTPTDGCGKIIISNGKFIEVSPYLGDIGLSWLPSKEGEPEKKARLILEEKVKKLENTVFCPKPTANLVTISKGKYKEVSPQLDKFDDLGLTCPPPKDKKPYKRESTGWH